MALRPGSWWEVTWALDDEQWPRSIEANPGSGGREGGRKREKRGRKKRKERGKGGKFNFFLYSFLQTLYMCPVLGSFPLLASYDPWCSHVPHSGWFEELLFTKMKTEALKVPSKHQEQCLPTNCYVSLWQVSSRNLSQVIY